MSIASRPECHQNIPSWVPPVLSLETNPNGLMLETLELIKDVQSTTNIWNELEKMDLKSVVAQMFGDGVAKKVERRGDTAPIFALIIKTLIPQLVHIKEDMSYFAEIYDRGETVSNKQLSMMVTQILENATGMAEVGYTALFPKSWIMAELSIINQSVGKSTNLLLAPFSMQDFHADLEKKFPFALYPYGVKYPLYLKHPDILLEMFLTFHKFYKQMTCDIIRNLVICHLEDGVIRMMTFRGKPTDRDGWFPKRVLSNSKETALHPLNRKILYHPIDMYDFDAEESTPNPPVNQSSERRGILKNQGPVLPPQDVIVLSPDEPTKQPVPKEPPKKMNFEVKYEKTTRGNSRKPDPDPDRFWNELCFYDVTHLISAFCGFKNSRTLRKDHNSVYEEIRKVCSEILENRKSITRAVLKEKADQKFGKQVSEINATELKTFVHQILDNVFLLNDNDKFKSAIPLKWRRINIYCGASLDTDLYADATNVETFYDKCMIGLGTNGVFGALDVPNAVKLPMRGEIRERMMRIVKFIVCDLIRTVFKSETATHKADKRPFIVRYYYDGDFDIPEKLRDKPEPIGDPTKVVATSDWKPLCWPSDEVQDAEDSHWVHEKDDVKNPNSMSYAYFFERHDIGQKRFPITEPDHQRNVQSSSKSTTIKDKVPCDVVTLD